MSVTVGTCTACRRSHHPAPMRCPTCGRDVNPQHRTGKGTVLSWTRVERPPTGFTAPQRVLLVQLDAEPEEPLGPLGLATTADDSALTVGARVHLETRDGRLHAAPMAD